MAKERQSRVRAIVNRGGGGAGDDAIARLRTLFADHGLDADVRAVAPEDLADACAAAAKDDGVDVLAIAGGDGTIATAAAALAGTSKPLGVLPLGTLNHFARDAGIPADLDAAVAAIAGGARRRVDVAEINGKVFVNNSSVGLYPDMVRRRERQQERLGRGKRLAMFWASLATLRSFRRHKLWISAPGLEAPIETPLLFVGNNRYQVELFALGTRQAIDEGVLSLYAIRARGRLHLLWAGIRGILGRLDQQRDFVTAIAGEAEITSDRARLGVATDGEQQRMKTPLRYRIRPGALTILVPAER